MFFNLLQGANLYIRSEHEFKDYITPPLFSKHENIVIALIVLFLVQGSSFGSKEPLLQCACFNVRPNQIKNSSYQL